MDTDASMLQNNMDDVQSMENIKTDFRDVRKMKK